MFLWTAFLLGLFGGLHCAGMCGPLMLALPSTGRSPVGFVTGRILNQLGRVLTYTALGLVAGTLGRTFAMAGIQQAVSIGLGLLMWTGLLVSPRMLELPWLARGVGGLQRHMGTCLRRRGPLSLFTLGALNGLLPCGLVYVAFAGAATTSSGPAGAESMAMFGLGTVPTMLGIGLTGRLATPALRLRLRRAVPWSIGLVGGLLILRGLSLGIPYLSPDLSSAAPLCHPVTPTESEAFEGLPYR